MDANKKGSERCPLIRKGKHRVLAFVFFLIYFAVLFYFLFFSEEMGRTYSERAYHYNLIPFHEIMRFVKYRHVLGWQAVVLNIGEISLHLCLLVHFCRSIQKMQKCVDDGAIQF